MNHASHKSESPGGAGQFANHIAHNIVVFPTVSESGKALATLKAKFALAGHQVHEGSNDDFIVTRWGMSRYCADIGALRRFARVVGVNHG